MLISRFVVSMFSIGIMVVFGAGVALGQDFPSKPIHVITAEAGAGTDLLARLIAQGLTASFGRQVIVENRGGLVNAIEAAAKAPSDGHWLLVHGSQLWTLPLLQKTSYDPVRDFSPITMLARAPNVLVVHPSLPVNSVKELIAMAKTKPGELNYASGGIGTSPHLAAELLKTMTGLNIVHVPYKGAGPGLNALLGGQVQLMFPNMSAAAPHIKAGRLKALAVTTAEPTSLAPGLPTMVASGLPGYESAQMLVVFAPARTPEAIVNRLNQEIVRFLKRADTQERLLSTGSEVVGNSPEEFAAAMKSDMAKMSRLIKDAGIRVE